MTNSSESMRNPDNRTTRLSCCSAARAYGPTVRASWYYVCSDSNREDVMLYTLAVILLIAWLLGIVGTYTIGAFVHVLLVIALVLFVVGLLSGRRTVV